METDHISQLLTQDPLMCHYEVVAKDTLPEVVSRYPSAFVCNTHDSDQPGEHWVAMYVDEIGDHFDPYGQKPQHAEFTNFMNSGRPTIIFSRALYLPFVVNTASLS